MIPASRTASSVVLSFAGLILAGACAPPDPVRGPDTVADGRPADGLLERPDLQQLVELQLQRDASALLERLDDADPVVRARAAFALGSVQDTLAAPRLLLALHDLDPRVRADAAFAVGQLPMTGVATPLFDALKVEWDRGAQEAQLDALGKRCEEPAALRLFQITDPALQPTVARAMSRCVIGGVAEDTLWTRLTRDLVSLDEGVREWSAYAFARHASPSRWDRFRVPVREALRISPSRDQGAMHLTRALGRALDRESLDLLGWWLIHGTLWQTRTNAAASLGQVGDVAAAPWLMRGLEDVSVQVRLQSALGLLQLPPSQALADQVSRWLARNPGSVAESAPLLELLARTGDAAAVGRWLNRSDIGDEKILLAGVRAAAVLPGLNGVTLLGRAGTVQGGRPARESLRAVRARWAESRPDPGTHETYRAAFQALERSTDPLVAEGARQLLADSAFLDPTAAPPRAPSAEPSASGAGEPARERPPFRGVNWDHLRRLGRRPLLHLETERGRVVVALRPEEAPLTVDAITATAQAGQYDGVAFHRVVPNFVAQGGDVTRGGVTPGARFVLRSEFTRIPYRRGVLGMASSGKDTETTQFFITHSPQPHLDGAYTAFGNVVQGMSVLDRIAPEDRIVRAWVEAGR